jgi:hypothetical protein
MNDKFEKEFLKEITYAETQGLIYIIVDWNNVLDYPDQFALFGSFQLVQFSHSKLYEVMEHLKSKYPKMNFSRKYDADSPHPIICYSPKNP